MGLVIAQSVLWMRAVGFQQCFIVDRLNGNLTNCQNAILSSIDKNESILFSQTPLQLNVCELSGIFEYVQVQENITLMSKGFLKVRALVMNCVLFVRRKIIRLYSKIGAYRTLDKSGNVQADNDVDSKNIGVIRQVSEGNSKITFSLPRLMNGR